MNSKTPEVTAATPVIATAPAQETQRAVRGYVIFTLATLILLAVAWKLLKVIEIVYVSAMFAVVLMPLVSAVERLHIRRWHPSRTIAIFFLMAVVVLTLGLLFWLGLPPVLDDLRGFTTDLPSRIPGMVAKIKHLPLAQKFGIDSLAQKAQAGLSSVVGYIFASLPAWAGHLLDVVTAVFLCLYFMLEGEHAYHYFLAWFRPEPRARLDRTLLVAEHRMSKWLLGQGTLMLILGVSSTIVFGLLHVRYFLLLGVLMGLLNLIPIAGGIITILLAAGVAALDSWTKMGLVLLFYAIYAQVENGFLTPRIMKSSVDLMGLTVLVALLIGSGLAGIVGALVSVPTAALVAVLMDEYMVQKDAAAQRLAELKGSTQP